MVLRFRYSEYCHRYRLTGTLTDKSHIRAAARLATQEARRSRQLPAAAVDAALQEAMRRAGPALAMRPRDSAQCAGGGGECATGAAGLLDVPRVGAKRSVDVAEDGRSTVRARLIL